MLEFNVIAFDADDTLWHNETLYVSTQEKFKKLLARYHPEEWIDKHLYETEMRNLEFYGYGIKSFTLSMIETAIELSEGRINGHEVKNILEFGREMMANPVEVLDDAEGVLHKLSSSYTLMLITKGDLIDQKSKLFRSGLESYFDHVEIVSNKSTETYAAVLGKHLIKPDRFLMVGNSMRSDILPVIAAGGQAVYIPYHVTWVHETVREEETSQHDYYQLQGIDQLPSLLDELSSPE